MAATGSPVITGTINGEPVSGLVLTADNSGIGSTVGVTPVGVNAVYSHQWHLDGVDVAGAINKTWIPRDSDIGKLVSVTATAINDLGNAESSTSPALPAISAHPGTTVDRSHSVNSFVFYAAPPIVQSDLVKLKKHEIILGYRSQMDDIGGQTWNAIKELAPDTKIYLYTVSTRTNTDQDNYALRAVSTVNRWADARGAPEGNISVDNADWVLRNADGDVIIFDQSYLSERGLDFGDQDAKDYVIKYTLNDIADQEWNVDGVYFDNSLVSDASIMANPATVPVLYPDDASWDAAMNGFMVDISQALHARGILVTANRGNSRRVTGTVAWAGLDALPDQPDFCLEEGFAVVGWGSGDALFWSLEDWVRQIEAAYNTVNSSIGYMSHTDLSPGQIGQTNLGETITYDQTKRFAVGSYLLAKRATGPKTYLAWVYDKGGLGFRQLDDPDATFYGMDIGDPVADYQAVPNSGLYYRQYSDGVVYVNPTATDETNVTRVDTTGSISVAKHDAVIEKQVVVNPNIIPFSEDFATWNTSNSSVPAADAGSPPPGVTETRYLRESTDTNNTSRYITLTMNPADFVDNEWYTFSIFIGAVSRDWVGVQIKEKDGGFGENIYFDVANGVVGGKSHPTRVTGGMTAVTGGYRVWVSVNINSGPSAVELGLFIADGDRDASIIGLGQDSLRISGAQVEMGTSPSTYMQKGVNTAPVLAPIGFQQGDMGTLITFDVSATDAESGTTITALNLPKGATFDGTTFNWTPTTAIIKTVIFTATDSQGATDSEQVTIESLPANIAPVLAPIGNQTVVAGETMSFTLSSNDPGDIVAYTASVLPPDSTLVNGVFTWPTTEAASFSVTFTATDSEGATDSETVGLSATANTAPVLTPIGDQSIVSGQELSFTVSATDAESAVTITTSGLPTGATFDGATFTWTPDAAGDTDVEFIATDTSGVTDSELITITTTAAALNLHTPPLVQPHPLIFLRQNSSPRIDGDHPSVLRPVVGGGSYYQFNNHEADALGSIPYPLYGNSTISDDFSRSGSKSVKNFWPVGSAAPGTGGNFRYPVNIVEGDETWFRLCVYFPAGFDFTCDPVIKFMRTNNGGGFNDVFIRSAGTLQGGNELVPASYDEYKFISAPLATGQWHVIEQYLKFGAVTGDGTDNSTSISRIWLNGDLIMNDRVSLNIVSNHTVLGSFWGSYWNGGSPVDQSYYVDDVIWTNTAPSTVDSNGYPFIGTI